MFLRSDGSAPAQFALLAGPLMLSFASALAVPILGLHKGEVTAAAAAIAERAARADVTDEEIENMINDVLGKLGLSNASASLSDEGGVQTAQVKATSIAGIVLEAVSFAADEA